MDRFFNCEFLVEIALEFGVEIAIIHGFFVKFYHMSYHMGDKHPSYPTIIDCINFIKFWPEDKIRQLVSELYLKKLI